MDLSRAGEEDIPATSSTTERSSEEGMITEILIC